MAKKKATKKHSKKAVKHAAKPAKKHAAKKHAPAKKSAPKKAAAKKAAPVKAAAPKSNMVNAYINFPGNCEEAFNYYKSLFGGKFGWIARFKEMPPMEGHPPMPEGIGEKVMHVSLPISAETSLMGSDAVEGFGPPMVAGNNFSISLSTKNRAEADRLFKGLSEGGQITMPIADAFWGSYFGMCTDKFGINWMVSFEQPKNK